MKTIPATQVQQQTEDRVCSSCGFTWCAAWCKNEVVLEGWIGDGICSIESVDMFDTSTREKRHELLDTCAQCPVRRQCAEFAIAAEIDEGIWGVDPATRRRIRAGFTTLDEVLAHA